MGSAAAAAQIPTSFGHELRACLRCRLVKTYDQLRESGCENCPFFNMESDHERVVECTTPNFTGIITVMDPTRSWAARWLRIVSVLPMITLPNLFLVWSLLMLQHFPGTRAWGKEGHFVICKIAEGLLSVDAAAAVKQLLPNESNGDLASTCSWADEIRYRRHWRWSSPLHYVDTPDYRCNYNYCRDCHDSAGHSDRCVSGAIYNYSSQLTTFLDISSQLKYNLTEALMFLSHFMGDIHQPLHVGFTGDYGGNTIVVRWFRRKTNLHHVWDTMIIEEAVKKIYNSNLSMMVQALMRNISENWSIAIPTWENCDSNATSCPDPYASESVRFACKYAYKNATPGSTLSDEYFKSRLPVVEKRLAQSGVRLASTLNRIFARHSSIALE